MSLDRTSVLKDWVVHTCASALLVLPLVMWLLFRATQSHWSRVGLFSSLLLGLPILAAWAGKTLRSAQIAQIREAEQSAADARVRGITAQVPVLLGFVGKDMRYVFANERYQDWLDICPESLIGKTPAEVFGDDLGLKMMEHLRRCMEGDTVAYEVRRPNGRVYSVAYSRAIQNDQLQGVYVAATDVTEYRAMEGSLAEERHRAQVTLQAIAEGVVACDANGRIEYANTAAARMLGRTTSEMEGRLIEEVLECVHADSGEAAATSLVLALRERQTVAPRMDCALYDNSRKIVFPVEESASPILSPNGELQGAVMVFHDVSDAREATERMRHLAYHDGLTGLPNRISVRAAIEQTLVSRAGSEDPALAGMLFVDADQFKHFNDSLGHAAGDRIIQAMGAKFHKVVGARGVVSRQGGDEFVIWIPEIQSAQCMVEIARGIHAEMQEGIHAGGASPVQLSVSMGISIFPHDGIDADSLLKNADLALYESKRLGRDQFQFFQHDLAAMANSRMQIDQDLRRAIRDHALMLHYQPIMDTRTGRIICVEALVRWPREGKMWLPGQFVPVAEESSLIADLDAWVLREACRQQREWKRAGMGIIPISVNLSMMRLNPEAFLAIMRNALSASGGSAQIQVEITESQMIQDPRQVEFLISELRALGVMVALDDFGTGYSNLSYLGAYRFDVLKIDRSFVSRIQEESCRQIIRAILAVGRSLGCRVVAEGVEEAEQVSALMQEGCDAVQGYLYARPMPADALEDWFTVNAQVSPRPPRRTEIPLPLELMEKHSFPEVPAVEWRVE